MTCWDKIREGAPQSAAHAHQGELAHPALQGGDDFLGRALADALQAAERFQVALFDRLRNFADGSVIAFTAFSGPMSSTLMKL